AVKAAVASWGRGRPVTSRSSPSRVGTAAAHPCTRGSSARPRAAPSALILSSSSRVTRLGVTHFMVASFAMHRVLCLPFPLGQPCYGFTETLQGASVYPGPRADGQV